MKGPDKNFSASVPDLENHYNVNVFDIIDADIEFPEETYGALDESKQMDVALAFRQLFRDVIKAGISEANRGEIMTLKEKSLLDKIRSGSQFNYNHGMLLMTIDVRSDLTCIIVTNVTFKH